MSRSPVNVIWMDKMKLALSLFVSIMSASLMAQEQIILGTIASFRIEKAAFSVGEGLTKVTFSGNSTEGLSEWRRKFKLLSNRTSKPSTASGGCGGGQWELELRPKKAGTVAKLSLKLKGSQRPLIHRGLPKAVEGARIWSFDEEGTSVLLLVDNFNKTLSLLERDSLLTKLDKGYGLTFRGNFGQLRFFLTLSRGEIHDDGSGFPLRVPYIHINFFAATTGGKTLSAKL